MHVMWTRKLTATEKKIVTETTTTHERTEKTERRERAKNTRCVQVFMRKCAGWKMEFRLHDGSAIMKSQKYQPNIDISYIIRCLVNIR